MTRSRINLFALATAAAVCLATLLALTLVNRASAPTAGAGAGPPAGGPPSTAKRIAALEASVRSHPERGAAYSLLGEAYLQRSRDTGDPTYQLRAEGILRRALKQDPRDAAALASFAALEAARHDFRAALRDGRAAQRLAPQAVRPYGVVVDALVELGRYGEAAHQLQRMLDLKPTVSSYARASYFRELHGDLAGAVQAMRLAASAGAAAPAQSAQVQTGLGNLELARGRHAAASRAYRTALAASAGYAPAQAGLARLDAAEGRLSAAIRRYRSIVARLPLPEHLVALGEAELAAGRRGDARRHFELVRAEQRRLRAAGVNSDAELALFEADHGRRGRALALAHRAWRSAPSVRSADAVGWALTRSGRPAAGLVWARKALRLGSRDPLLRLHAGLAARRAGRNREASRQLRLASAGAALLSPLARAELGRAG